MKKIIVFYGSDRAFSELLPTRYRNLSDIAMQMDFDSKQMEVRVTGLPQQEDTQKEKKEKKPKINVSNFVIFADEYSSVNEHVIINFISFLAKLNMIAYLSITKRLELRDVMKGILVSTCGVPVQ